MSQLNNFDSSFAKMVVILHSVTCDSLHLSAGIFWLTGITAALNSLRGLASFLVDWIPGYINSLGAQ